MKKKYKTILISFGVVGLLAFALFGAILGSGNDGYAQKYEFEVSSAALIKAVENLKSGNPTFNPPAGIYEPDSLDTSNSHFNVEVYSKKENISFGFFIEKDDSKLNKSFLYLVSINRGTDFRDWKFANRDLNRSDNLKVKKVFEEEILNKLKLTYKNKGNGMFIFWK